jgi:hypothetical protein
VQDIECNRKGFSSVIVPLIYGHGKFTRWQEASELAGEM